MLSYLHGFHAGNFADVHKHHTLVALLASLNRKEKPWSYLETHSGKAAYDLSDDQALKTLEFKEGIAKLWAESSVDESLVQYLECVKKSNGETLESYPGSPAIAASMAREADKLHLMELHPNEVNLLKQVFRRDPRVSVHH
jgi:23S rRNA (adenine2030-N6)-methyltransferase